MVVADTALASTMVSPHVTTTAPSASLAILPVSIEMGVAPIWAVTFCCILLAWMCYSRPVTLTVGFKPARGSLTRGERHDPKLKPKIQGDYCTWNGGYILLLIYVLLCRGQHAR